MAISGLATGLGAGFSGYTNFLRFLLERQMREQEQQRQSGVAREDREAAYQNQVRFHQFLTQQRQEEEARAARNPLARLGLIRDFGSVLPQGVDIAGLLQEAGLSVPQRTVPTITQPGVGPAPGQGIAASPFEALGEEQRPTPILYGGPQRTITLAEAAPETFGQGAPGASFGHLPAPMKEGRADPEAIALIAQRVGLVVSPEQKRLQEKETEDRRRVAFEASLKQLRDKLDSAVEVGKENLTRAQEIVRRMDALNAQFPQLGISGIDEFRAAKDRARKAKLTESGQMLQQELTRIRIARGEGGATETLSQQTLGLRKKYLSGQTLTPQEERLLFGSQGEEIIPARDRQILQTWRQNLSPIDGKPIDPDLDKQLRPVAQQIIQRLAAPSSAAPQGPQGQTLTRVQLRAIAVKHGVSEAEAEQQARTQGYTVEPAAAPGAGAAQPAKTITRQQIIDEAKRRGMLPLHVLDEYRKKGYQLRR